MPVLLVHPFMAANMSCSRGFFSPTECTKRSLFLFCTISFTAIYLISYFYTSHRLAALPKSDDLHMESEKTLLEKIFTSFKQISGKENGELPPGNEKSGNKTTPTPTPTPAQSFTFLINEAEKCKDKTPFLVLLISTRAAELQHRRAIRRSWGDEAAVPGADVVRLFMLGVEAKGTNEELLRRESEQYHDIIQQDFLDTYNNLTLKTLMGMRWVASYCNGTRFAMKTDSDVFVNTAYLIEKLLRPLPPLTQNYFTGHLMKGHRPIRSKASKWYISEEEFPGNRYHPFCSGTGYVFSGDLAAKIGVYQAQGTVAEILKCYSSDIYSLFQDLSGWFALDIKQNSMLQNLIKVFQYYRMVALSPNSPETTELHVTSVAFDVISVFLRC